MTSKNSIYLSGNTLKIIAALSMLIDHIGHILFPQYVILRIIGRVSFPIFAFMIAEGCYYTKNKLRYFFVILSLGAACQTVSYLYDHSLDMGILVTFSLSILAVYALQNLKEKLFSSKVCFCKKCCAAIMFLLTVAAVYFLNVYLDIDYGFWGCMLPVFASVFKNTKTVTVAMLKDFDCLSVHVLMLGVGLLLLSAKLGEIQMYSLLALPFLLLYSGKRGRLRMKLFFYIFYPAHLVVLQAIHVLFQK